MLCVGTYFINTQTYFCCQCVKENVLTPTGDKNFACFYIWIKKWSQVFTFVVYKLLIDPKYQKADLKCSFVEHKLFTWYSYRYISFLLFFITISYFLAQTFKYLKLTILNLIKLLIFLFLDWFYFPIKSDGCMYALKIVM